MSTVQKFSSVANLMPSFPVVSGISGYSSGSYVSIVRVDPKDVADVAVAKKRLADPKDKVRPFGEVCKELGL